jgi:hypothetical protein
MNTDETQIKTEGKPPRHQGTKEKNFLDRMSRMALGLFSFGKFCHSGDKTAHLGGQKSFNLKSKI